MMIKRPKHKINPYMEHYEQFQKELIREMKIDQFGDLLEQHTKKIKQLIGDGQLSRQQYLKYASKLLQNSKLDEYAKVSTKSSYSPYQIPSTLAFSENVSEYDKEIEYLKSNDYRNYLSSLLKGVENEKDLIKEMKNARSNSIYLLKNHRQKPNQIPQPILKKTKNFVPTTQFSPIRKIDQKQSKKCLNNQRQKSLNRLVYLNDESFDLFGHQINEKESQKPQAYTHQKKCLILKENKKQRSLQKSITKMVKQKKSEIKCQNSSIFWHDAQEYKKVHLKQKVIEKQNINYSPIHKKSLQMQKERPVETPKSSIYCIDFKLGQLSSKNVSNKIKGDGNFHDKSRSRFGQKQTRQTSVSKSLSSRSLCRKKSKLSLVSSHTKVSQ